MGYPQQASDGKPRHWKRGAWALIVFLTLLPLLLYVVLGSHSRLVGDDFCFLTSGQEYGPIGSVQFWRNTLNGSFSFYFLHGLSAPLDTQTPGVFVAIIIVAWTFGLTWLIRAGFQLFGADRPPLATSFVAASALVCYSIHGLVTPGSLYIYAISPRYTLPIAILTIALAAASEVVPRTRSTGKFAAACLMFALVAFLNAGLAETYGVVQLALLTTMLPAIYTLVPRERRQQCLAFGISGCAATLAALSVMATAPGVARRLEWMGRTQLPNPAEDILKIIVNLVPNYIDEGQVTGFIGALALALCLMLTIKSQDRYAPIRKPFQLAFPPLLLCLLAQALLLPLVWTNQSDNPLVFGRFSPAYMVVVGAQVFLLLSLAATLLARKRINSLLRNRPDYWAVIPVLTLGAVYLLAGLNLFRSINWRAASFVAGSIYSLLFALLWQFHIHLQANRIKNRFVAGAAGVMLVMSSGAMTLVMLTQVIGGEFYNPDYNLSFIPFAFTFSGFICGITLANMIKRVLDPSLLSTRLTRLLGIGSALVAILIWSGILLGNIRNVPDFERFSRAWDDRHQLILAKRAAGERLEAVPQLAEDFFIFGDDPYYMSIYWTSSCASDEVSRLIEARYRA